MQTLFWSLEYFCGSSSKLTFRISSYAVSKLMHFLRHSVCLICNTSLVGLSIGLKFRISRVTLHHRAVVASDGTQCCRIMLFSYCTLWFKKNVTSFTTAIIQLILNGLEQYFTEILPEEFAICCYITTVTVTGFSKKSVIAFDILPL